MKHPSDEALLSWCDAKPSEGHGVAVSAVIAPAVEGHLSAGCEQCQTRLHELGIVLEWLREPRLEEAPEGWVQEALSRIPAQSPTRQAAAPVGILQRIVDEIVMSLTLDTRLGASLAGIRGTLGTRQILFETKPDPARGSLHLQVEGAPRGKLELRGQLVAGEGLLSAEGPDSAALEIQAAGRTPETRECRLSRRGEFRFRSLPQARVQLRISSGGRVFLAGPFDLD